jgi:hypothetical protein
MNNPSPKQKMPSPFIGYMIVWMCAIPVVVATIAGDGHPIIAVGPILGALLVSFIIHSLSKPRE